MNGRSTACALAFHDVVSGNNTVTVIRPSGKRLTIQGYRAAPGWDAVTGWGSPRVAVLAPRGEVVLEPAAGSREDGVVPDLLFLRVPEDKTIKNRLHLDLRPQNQEAEVKRLIGLGARHVSVGQDSDVSWIVLADPDGNEFCVLQARSE